jgi:hypothetical protein
MSLNALLYCSAQKRAGADCILGSLISEASLCPD